MNSKECSESELQIRAHLQRYPHISSVYLTVIFSIDFFLCVHKPFDEFLNLSLFFSLFPSMPKETGHSVLVGERKNKFQ